LIAPDSLYGGLHAQDTPEYARAYAELGLAVVPVHGMVAGACTCGKDCGRDAGKHPIAQLVKRGVKDASTCLETVDGWWREWPAANVAIACGFVSKIVVVDADGEAGVAELERRGYPLTWTARSGSGGLHPYLGHPCHLVGNWRISGIGDLRADGTYIVAPPSRHRSGERYEWLPGLSPWDVDLAPAPSWVPLEESQKTPRLSPPANLGPPPRLSRLSRKMQELIGHGNRGDYESRSDADFAACLAMFGAGYAETEVWAVMTDPANAISEKFFQKGSDGERYLTLTIGKARAQVAASPRRRGRVYARGKGVVSLG
jgi:putative DNA primase/helicase